MEIHHTKVEKLEIISMKLEKVKEDNPVVADMRWLAKELRKAWNQLQTKGKQ